MSAWRSGDEEALGALIPKIYPELKRIASRALRRHGRHSTLQTTELVNEAYQRLITARGESWQNRVHFFAVCAQIMRWLLIDQARHSGRAKRGAGAVRLSLDELRDVPLEREPRLVDLDEALENLAERDPLAGRIVELRFFGGLRREEIAEVLSVSSATVTRRWKMAQIWLSRELSVASGDSEAGV